MWYRSPVGHVASEPLAKWRLLNQIRQEFPAHPTSWPNQKFQPWLHNSFHKLDVWFLFKHDVNNFNFNNTNESLKRITSKYLLFYFYFVLLTYKNIYYGSVLFYLNVLYGYTYCLLWKGTPSNQCTCRPFFSKGSVWYIFSTYHIGVTIRSLVCREEEKTVSIQILNGRRDITPHLF